MIIFFFACACTYLCILYSCILHYAYSDLPFFILCVIKGILIATDFSRETWEGREQENCKKWAWTVYKGWEKVMWWKDQIWTQRYITRWSLIHAKQGLNLKDKIKCFNISRRLETFLLNCIKWCHCCVQWWIITARGHFTQLGFWACTTNLTFLLLFFFFYYFSFAVLCFFLF